MNLLPHRSLRAPVVVLGVIAAIAAGVACSTSTDKASGVGEAKVPEGAKAIDHEKCDDSMGRVEVIDANGDGKPDIKRVYDKATGRELCRVADLNHDGKPDMYEYYTADGTLRRREAAYDTSDSISDISTYENGKLVKRERDTFGNHKIDTWDTYDPGTGKIVKRERDTNGDGKVDEWWTFESDKITIAVDKNGDGQPDPNDTITLGPNGQAIAPPTPTAASGGADAGGSTIPPPPPPPVLMMQSTPTDAGVADGGKKPKKGPAKK